MNVLTLSAKHKERLIQMCDDLFPEMTNIKFSRISVDKVHFSNYTQKEVYDEAKPLVHFEVHWFELCCRELSTRLFAKIASNGPSELAMYLANFGQNLALLDSHPVDSLYPIFEEYKRVEPPVSSALQVLG